VKTLGFPFSSAVEDEGDQGSHQPGRQQGNPDTFVPSVGQLRGSGQPGNSVSYRHTDHDGCDQRDPHRSHCISRSAHNAGKTLVHRHRNVTHRHNPHHIGAQRHKLGSVGKNRHQIPSKHKDHHSNHRGCTHRHQRTLFGSLLHAVISSGSHVLSSKGGQCCSEGKVRHHREAIHTHDDDVCRNDHLSEAVGQRLYYDHRHGKDRL